MRRPLLLMAGTFLSSHAFALDPCKISPDDQQVRICVYNPLQRYVVTGLVGYPVNLRFGEAEVLKRSEPAYTGQDASGKPSQTWKGPEVHATAAKDGSAPIAASHYQNNLPIWPFHEGRSALLVVTQMPDGAERTYQFDLTARRAADCTVVLSGGAGCADDTQTTASLVFTYPADQAAEATRVAAEKKQAAIVAWQQQQAAKKEAAGIARLKTDVFYGPRNFAYQAKAEPRFKNLEPSEISDNGWLTEMQWPENVQIPTVTMIDPTTGEERIAPVSQQGRMQIINGTSEWFRLRLGTAAVMDIHNLGWSKNRPDPGTGTTSPDVLRTVMFQDRK